jgi:hypothetical protein
MNTNKRTQGTNEELATLTLAVDAIIALFEQIMERWAKEDKEKPLAVVQAIRDRRINVRAHLDLDTDGLLVFRFYSLKEGEEPKLIFDGVPTQKVN